jgi:hypothetical protein
MSHFQQARISTAFPLSFYPDDEGVPSSASIQIVDDSGGDLVAETATGVDIDPYSQTITTGARGADSIVVASGVGAAVGTRYWATDPGGRGLEVEAAGVNSTTVTLTTQLPWSLAGGSLDGMRISYTVPASILGTLRRCYQVVWRYTVGGVEVVKDDDLFDVVRTPFKIPVRLSDLANVDPAFARGIDYLRLRERVVDDIASELSNSGIYPDLVKDRRLLVPVAVYGLLALRHIRDEDLFTRYSELRQGAMARFLESKSWVDLDDDGARAASQTTTTGAVATWPAGRTSNGYDESEPPINYMRTS